MMQYNEIGGSDSEEEESQEKTFNLFLPKQQDADELIALRLENKELREELDDLKRRLKNLEDELMTKNVQLETVAGEYDYEEDTTFQRQLSVANTSKKWSLFTKEEDEKIMAFLRNHKIRHIGIKSGTWEMMKKKSFPDSPHTVQSLETHYRKSIVPKLAEFIPDKEERDIFRRKVESPLKRRRT